MISPQARQQRQAIRLETHHGPNARGLKQVSWASHE
jgi:hypothetical protein